MIGANESETKKMLPSVNFLSTPPRHTWARTGTYNYSHACTHADMRYNTKSSRGCVLLERYAFTSNIFFLSRSFIVPVQSLGAFLCLWILRPRLDNSTGWVSMHCNFFFFFSLHEVPFFVKRLTSKQIRIKRRESLTHSSIFFQQFQQYLLSLQINSAACRPTCSTDAGGS